ncbi:acyltransferase [Janibacter cremeus]|uniref:acyltransferase n=1 Tax=Janibacter cremeus TaxID=1285192 RepID=UPI0023F64478|nr:acyltransferase [Janibacter cremeus]WEV78217.1 acyltransferase [Janibacter cremeus]WEV78297.1 acyltransferase [Janibacter cremeus]
MKYTPKRLFWWALYQLVASRFPSWVRPLRPFRAYCASHFAHVSRKANINRHARLSWDCSVADHGGVGEGSILSGGVHIGPHVTMGPYCYFITGDHPVPKDYGRFRDEVSTRGEIFVEEDVFLGGRVIVLPGVTIGRGAAVGAGSVVAKDVPPGATVVGNPARIIRQRKV